jgi:hypothetical protein
VLKVKCIGRVGQGSTVVDNNGVVIVEDEYGNPIVVVVYIQAKTYTVVTADDPDFNRILQGLGIDKIVVNEPMEVNFPPTQDLKLIRGPAGFNL